MVTWSTFGTIHFTAPLLWFSALVKVSEDASHSHYMLFVQTAIPTLVCETCVLETVPQLSSLHFNLKPLVILTTGTSCRLKKINYSEALGINEVHEHTRYTLF